jgi:hypothetical protein
MRLGNGRIIEIRQTGKGSRQALIQLEGVSTPLPGQYLQAHHLADHSQAAGLSLFPGGLPDAGQDRGSSTTAGPIPSHWSPGDVLRLRGPLGRGFNIPEEATRLAIIAFSQQIDHLLPLAKNLLNRGRGIALFTNSNPDSLPTRLPARIEINKLDQIAEGLKWADFVACSVSLDEFSSASEVLSRLSPLGRPGEILVYGQYPCAGLADCGICAVSMPNGGSKPVCKEGPVLEI